MRVQKGINKINLPLIEFQDKYYEGEYYTFFSEYCEFIFSCFFNPQFFLNVLIPLPNILLSLKFNSQKMCSVSTVPKKCLWYDIVLPAHEA